MTLYPGWDSLDSVKTWHTVFEISGIVILALLVGAEVLAFQYGHRKDELTALAEGNAETQRKADADAAEQRRKTEVNALQKQLTEAGKKVSDLEAKQPQRRLTDAQKSTLLAAMTPFSGQKVTITNIMGDIYGRELAQDFVDLAKAAHWDVGGSPIQAGFAARDPVGIIVGVNNEEAKAGIDKVPKAIGPLITTLFNLRLVPKALVEPFGADPGQISIIIGKKPSP